ncbi:MAG TPA: pantoate--beta-alanine ligase, partial [Polyangiaceae bacterium]|nr:pantoate--beta-alanine ligase [Polyangiaceae bacterium]
SKAARAFDDGERSVAALRALVIVPLEEALDSVDYVTVADADDVSVLSDDDAVADRAVLAVAARVGATRLIDNLVLGEDPAPVQP